MLNKTEISNIRGFNRRYTKLLGILNKRVFDTPLSWTEGRIILEIFFYDDKTPIEVATNLDLDKSYTSRILNRFEKKGWLQKTPSPTDSRSVRLSLTADGLQLAQKVDDRSNEQIEDLLGDLSASEQKQFYQAMTTLDQLLFSRK